MDVLYIAVSYSLVREKSFSLFIAFSSLQGFLCTNYAFSLCNASFVETIKGSEPIFSMILTVFVLKTPVSVSSFLSTLVWLFLSVALSAFRLLRSLWGVSCSAHTRKRPSTSWASS